MWFINVIWSIPTLLLGICHYTGIGKRFLAGIYCGGSDHVGECSEIGEGTGTGCKGIGICGSDKSMGFSDFRTIVRHIWPNIMGPVMVIAASNFASAIVIEAGLSFLGIGVQPPQPSWGLMIKENYNFIITQNPMLALAPGFAIMLLVLAFNLLGNGLRDALNVRGRV